MLFLDNVEYLPVGCREHLLDLIENDDAVLRDIILVCSLQDKARASVKDAYTARFSARIELQPLQNWQLPQSFRSLTFQEKFPTGLRWAGPFVSRIAAPRPVIRKSKCIGCGRCAESCPRHLIDVVDRKAVIVRKGCIACFCCQEMCPAHAIDAVRKRAW